MTLSGTHARDVFATQGVARVARVVRRDERDKHVTDRGKRAELRRAETEEVQLLAGVRFVPVWKRREGKPTSVLTRRRQCRRPYPCVGQRKSHVPFDGLPNTTFLNSKYKNHRTIMKRSATLLKKMHQTTFRPSIMYSGDEFQTTT